MVTKNRPTTQNIIIKQNITYQVVGLPSGKEYKKIVCMNIITNCPMSVNKINVANSIFGPTIHKLK